MCKAGVIVTVIWVTCCFIKGCGLGFVVAFLETSMTFSSIFILKLHLRKWGLLHLFHLITVLTYYPYFTFRYSITYGNPYPRVFSIMEDTGQLTVITTLDRDRTGGGEYNLRIKARDVGVPSLSSQVNVKVIVEDVNDNAPSFRYPSYT